MRSNPCLPVLVVVSVMLTPPLASAAAQRTFVSSAGVDNVNCSLASPCRAFAAAITATSAGGEVIVLDSAGYGPVTIAKSVSLIAPTGIYAGITVFSGNGITVNAPGAIVVLRGLSINGQGGSNGVNVLQAARVRIESCVISNMAVDGVMHSAPGAELMVLDTIVRDNGGSGIGGDADAFVVLDHVRSEHNGTNGFYMASLTVGGEARAMISDSVFAFNGSNGVWFAATGGSRSEAHVTRSVMTENGGAGVKVSSNVASVIFADVTRNAIQRNNGNGVTVVGPGSTQVAVTENTINHFTSVGVSSDGDATLIFASANVVNGTGTAFVRAGLSTFYTYGNNIGLPPSVGFATLPQF